MANKIVPFEEACAVVHRAKTDGRKVAFTSGSFDILHVGHVVFLEDCRRGADLLIVGLDDNDTVRKAKGEERPFFDETERAKVMSALEIVTLVFVFRGPCSASILAWLAPDEYCFSKFDPKAEAKTTDAQQAGVSPKPIDDDLKFSSTTRVSRLIRFNYFLESWGKHP